MSEEALSEAGMPAKEFSCNLTVLGSHRRILSESVAGSRD